MTGTLTQEDVYRLVLDPSVENRALAAGRIAGLFGSERLSDSERRLAEDIIACFVRDAEVRVREALVEQLKSSPRLPHDLALALARDFDSVALPMLQFSVVLTADDLVALMRDGTADRQVAIAQRDQLSAVVGDAIAAHAAEPAVVALLENQSADVTSGALGTMLDRFPESPAVHVPMAHRPVLPIGIAERLIVLVADQLRVHLATHHALPADIAAEIVQETRERATLGLASASDAGAALAREMHASGRLTPSIAIRALCLGDISFFEAALGFRAGVPVTNARVLIHDGGLRGLTAIFNRAGMPDRLLPLVRNAIDLVAELDYDGEPFDRERYRRRMIERLLTRGDDFQPDDLAYFLRQLGRTPTAGQAWMH